MDLCARRMSYRLTNNERLLGIYKYNLYFYSSTATFVWSKNTVRESSHTSFFCGGDPFCEVERRPENTHGESWSIQCLYPVNVLSIYIAIHDSIEGKNVVLQDATNEGG